MKKYWIITLSLFMYGGFAFAQTAQITPQQASQTLAPVPTSLEYYQQEIARKDYYIAQLLDRVRAAEAELEKLKKTFTQENKDAPDRKPKP
jgi:hypothetical protein